MKGTEKLMMTTNFKADGNIAKENATQIINATYNQSAPPPVTPIDICLRMSNWPNPSFIKTDVTAIDGVLNKAIEWIFRHDHFKKWHGEQNTMLLWIVGSAGKGKSTMTAGIVNELKKPSTVSVTSNTKATVGYFFCRSSSENTNTAVDILKGLIYSLSDDSVQLGQYLYRHWDEREQAFDPGVERLELLWHILRNMLNHPDQSPTYIIIDGLDECDGTIDALLRLIGTDGLALSRPVKWLLTSRPLQLHQRQLILEGPRQHQIILDDHSSEMKDAIREYVAVKVRHTALSAHKEVEIEKIQNLLVNKAEETFLWVSLVCREIANLPAKEAVDIISTVPKRIFALYDRGMQKICNGCQKGDEQSLRCWQLIWTRHTLHSDPHIVELAKLAGIQDDGEPYLRELVSACNGFLLLSDNKFVRLIHTSAKDYLDHSRTQPSVLSIGIPNHELVTERCLRILNQKLCRNISRLDWADSAAADVRAEVKEGVRSQIGYSCTHWAKHLSVAGISLALAETMQQFLFSHFLHWIEALCALNRLYGCMIDLETTISLLESTDCLELLHFVIEARTFVQLNGSRLERWPLQIYSSLLIFSQQQTFVAEYLAVHQPPWVIRCSKHNMAPSLPLWTIETDSERIFNMAYSPSGNALVTQSAAAVRLWRPEESSRSIVLLGETNWLRNASTGYWRFMEDETKVVATLFDENYSSLYWTATWDAITGDMVKEKTEHDHEYRRNYSQTYSEDLRWIASFDCIQDLTLISKDIAGSNISMTFPSKPARLHAFPTFSPNNEYLAAVYDGSLHIWSITGRRHVASTIINCQENSDLPFGIRSLRVQFSKNSERLICHAECGLGVYIWSCDVSQILLRDESIVDHASQSPDRSLHSTTNCTIDLRPKEFIIRMRVLSEIRDPIFSPNGEYAAAVTKKCIIIAETETGCVLRIIDGHFEAVAFTPEPVRLASADSHGTIQVWAVRTNGRHPLYHVVEPNTLPMLTSIEREIPVMSYISSGSLDWIGPDTEYEFIIPSPDSQYVCLGLHSSGVHLLNRLSGESFQVSSLLRIFEQCMFSPDNQWFATSIVGEDREPPEIQVWSTSSKSPSRSVSHDDMRPRHSFLGKRDSIVQAMAFSRDSSLLFCSYAPISALFPRIMLDVLDLRNGRLRTIRGPLCTNKSGVYRGVACVSSDNSLVASTFEQNAKMINIVVLQDSKSTPFVLSTKLSPLEVIAMRFSPSGDLLAVQRGEGKLEVYSISILTSAFLSRVLPKHTDPIAQFDGLEALSHFEFTPDGQQIRMNCGTIHIRDNHISRSLESCLPEISFDGQWVCLGTRRILWLPPEYRPSDAQQTLSLMHSGLHSLGHWSKFRRTYFSSNWIWSLDSTNCIIAIKFDLDFVKELIQEQKFT